MSLLWSLDIAVKILVLTSLTIGILVTLDKLKLLEPFKLHSSTTPTITHTNTINNSKPSIDTVTTTTLDGTIKWLEDLGGKK